MVRVRRAGHLLRRPGVRSALLVTLLADIAQGIFAVLFIVFVARRRHGGPGETGLLRGVQAAGAIARRSRLRRRCSSCCS
jgi:hypothetical protein